MDLQLRGKTALVTGASMGIGRAIATALATEGVRVAAAARRAELLATLADEIVVAGGTAPNVLVQDLTAEGAAVRLHDAAMKRWGTVAILVNCAGGSRPLPTDAPEERPEDYRRHVAETEIPMKYWGEPEDLAVLAVFHAAPPARYVNGTVIPVDGGLRRYQS